MLRPWPESLERLDEFQRKGRLEIGDATVERRGPVGYLLHGNPRFLNAEDDVDDAARSRSATDLLLLDSAIEVGVLRGKVVDHAKYAGRACSTRAST